MAESASERRLIHVKSLKTARGSMQRGQPLHSADRAGLSPDRGGLRRRCLPGPRRSRRRRSGSRRSRWSACPMRACAKAGIGSGARFGTQGSSFRRTGSRSTSLPQTCARRGASFDLPIALGILAASGVVERRHIAGPRSARRAVAGRFDSRGARRAADCGGGAARRPRAAFCCRRPMPARRRLSTGSTFCRCRRSPKRSAL